MKKVLLVTMIASAVVGGKVQAQHAQFGVKGGFNVANIHSSNSTTPDAKISGHAGILAHIHFTDQFALQPEVLYSGQGAKETIAAKDYKYSLGYLNIPVLGQYMFGDGFRVETGPQIGFLLGAHIKNSGNSADIKSSFKTTDFSWSFGVGYVSRMGLGVDARYNLGLNNINNTNSGDKLHNRVFQAGIFYQFRQIKL